MTGVIICCLETHGISHTPQAPLSADGPIRFCDTLLYKMRTLVSCEDNCINTLKSTTGYAGHVVADILADQVSFV